MTNENVIPTEDGRIIAWIVFDQHLGDLIITVPTRSEAREIAEACCGRVAVVRASH